MPLDRQAEAADEAIHPPVQLDLSAMLVGDGTFQQRGAEAAHGPGA